MTHATKARKGLEDLKKELATKESIKSYFCCDPTELPADDEEPSQVRPANASSGSPQRAELDSKEDIKQ